MAASRTAGIRPGDVFLPRPSASPAQIQSSETQGYVSPLYNSTPAPIGLAEFGLAQNSTTGGVSPFILNATSLQATFDPAAIGGPNATYLTDSSPDGYAVQLNAVATNVTLFGNDSYEFWTQNVVEYYPYAHTIYLLTNVWNFSSPASYLSSNAFYSHGPDGIQVGNSYYYAVEGPLHIGYPFNLTFTMTSTVTEGRNAVYFSVYATTPDSANDIHATNFDYVVFNSLAIATAPLTQPADYTANGHTYNPLGLTNDFELTIGGPGGGSQTTFLTANAEETLSYWDAAAASYEAVPSAYCYGGETGETAVGASMAWAPGASGAPVGQMTTGPSLLGGLWNASAPAGGAARLTLSVQPGNAFVEISFAGDSSSAFNVSEPEWAPTVDSNVFTLPAGTYNVTIALADYAPQTLRIVLGAGTASTRTIDLVWTPTEGIYTPLWAWTNAQIAAISTSGSGTIASPYIVVNNQLGELPRFFGVLNDYGFPVFPGVYFLGTTAYTEFASPPPLSVDTAGAHAGAPPLPASGNLPYWFYEDSNIAIVNATGISGWFSVYADSYPFFLTFNVEFWNSTNTLIANDTFNTAAQALLLYNGNSSTNPHAAGNATIWGNRFDQVQPPGPAGPVVPFANGLGLSEQENRDLIYNNEFSTPTTAVSYPADLYYGDPVAYVDAWNITPTGASTVHHDANWPAFPLTGSIIGTRTQGGNFWWDYGLAASPYGFLGGVPNFNPYDVVPYTESGWLDQPGPVAGDYAPLLATPLYTVTVSETGLPTPNLWFATLRNATGAVYGLNLTSTPSYSVSLPNGSYSVTAAPTSGYYAPTALFAVAGRAVLLSVTFTLEYVLTFVPGGLPTSQLYIVDIPGSGSYSNIGGTNLRIDLPSGTYTAWIYSENRSYAPIPPSYYVVVGRANQTLAITFAPAFPLSFSQVGLPVGASWEANSTLQGITAAPPGSATTPLYTYSVNGTGSHLNLSVPSGSYAYAVQSTTSGFVPSTPGGTFTVAESPITVPPVTFGFPYSLRFIETGLPNGSTWYVGLHGNLESTTASTLEFTLPNGTYGYTVGTATGYAPSPASGVVSLNGTGESVPIVYSAVSYSVTFTESGLPRGTNWSVSFGGVTNFSTGSSIGFSSAAGTYGFAVPGVPGWSALPDNGTLTVHGPTTQAIAFSVATYPVTFTESGLVNGTSWTVTLNGSPHSSTTSAITIAEPSGQYVFFVSLSGGLSPTPITGTVTVNGSAVNLPIQYSPTLFSIVFEETGLSPGTTWSVEINGVTVSSTTTTITFPEPNGTYVYTASASGYNSTTRGLTVAGANPAQTLIVFSSTTGPSALSATTWIIIAVVVVLATAIVVALALRRRGRRASGGPR
ncbi:MAG: thermopsin family protease [Thermoplasmata archaeon]